MTDSHKDRRIVDASGLVRQINSLDKVEADQRIGFVHDSLMSAIDDICSKHKAEGQVLFNQRQLLALKDISFHIVYILDKRNHPPGNLLVAAYRLFRSSKLFDKIMLLAALVTILVGVSGPVSSAYDYLSRLRITENSDDPVELDVQSDQDGRTVTRPSGSSPPK